MSKDIRSFFDVVAKKSTSNAVSVLKLASEKRAIISDSDGEPNDVEKLRSSSESDIYDGSFFTCRL